MSDELKLKEAPMTPNAAVSSGYGLMQWGTNGFAGAATTRSRGFIYFPELDTRKEINAYTRVELMRRARWMYANLGFVKRILNGIPSMVVGTGLQPQPFTDDKEWNDLALRAFERRASSKVTFDVASKFNFAESQRAVTRWRLRDGDCSVALTESQAKRAQFAFYEAHQMGDKARDDGWLDGVKCDRLGGAIAYRLLGDGDAYADIPARDLIFLCDYERAGQNRGLTCLHAAVNHLLDTTEIFSFLKQGIKSSNRVGYYLADKGGPQPNVAGQMGHRQQITTGDGNSITVEKVYGDGGEVPKVPGGKELRLLADNRPSPNTLGFVDYLLRDIAWGTGFSVDLLWNISALGGANTRFVMADAQGRIDEEQQWLVDNYCTRVWIYTIAKEMKYGGLRRCTDPEWMFKIGWIPPARRTVDFGKDGKLHLEQMKQGMLTFRRFYGWHALRWKSEIDQWLDEKAYIKEGAAERGLTMADLYAGQAGIAKADDTLPDDEEDDELPASRQREPETEEDET